MTRKLKVTAFMTATVLTCALTCSLGAPNAASAQDIGDTSRGLAYAERVCAECHAVRPGGMSPRAESPPFTQIANAQGMTAVALKVFFQTPHVNMPNLMIPAADRDDVIAYIMSLREAR
jgi:mono/diheme cytochrome c family protein